MNTIFVVDRQQHWPFEIPGSTVVAARTYLGDSSYSNDGEARVVNLCRADRYQGRGYYVSLLAEARGQRPLPDVKTIEDLQAQAQVQTLAAQLGELARHSLRHDASDLFELDAYFGRDPAGLHEALAEQLFALAQAPLIRSRFSRVDGVWTLTRIVAIGLADVPPQHRPVLLAAATEFVTGDPRQRPGRESDAKGRDPLRSQPAGPSFQ